MFVFATVPNYIYSIILSRNIIEHDSHSTITHSLKGCMLLLLNNIVSPIRPNVNSHIITDVIFVMVINTTVTVVYSLIIFTSLFCQCANTYLHDKIMI